MKKWLVVLISSLFCYMSVADLYNLYGLDHLRDTLPPEIQNIIARYILSSIDTDFITQPHLGINTSIKWKLTRVLTREPVTYNDDTDIIDHTHYNFEPTRTFGRVRRQSYSLPSLKLKAYKRADRNQHKKSFYLEQTAPYLLVVKPHGKTLASTLPSTICYSQERVIDFFWLDQSTMKVHIILGSEEHIWEPSRSIEDYLPYNAITLEQVLLLMLLNHLHVQLPTIDLAHVAYKYKNNLSKNLPTHSLRAIINYLEALLKSFGPDLEAVITQYYAITNMPSSRETYELLSCTHKNNTECLVQ